MNSLKLIGVLFGILFFICTLYFCMYFFFLPSFLVQRFMPQSEDFSLALQILWWIFLLFMVTRNTPANQQRKIRKALKQTKTRKERESTVSALTPEIRKYVNDDQYCKQYGKDLAPLFDEILANEDLAGAVFGNLVTAKNRYEQVKKLIPISNLTSFSSGLHSLIDFLGWIFVFGIGQGLVGAVTITLTLMIWIANPSSNSDMRVYWMIFAVFLTYGSASWVFVFFTQRNSPRNLRKKIRRSLIQARSVKERESAIAILAPKTRKYVTNDQYCKTYGGDALAPLFYEILNHEDLAVAIFGNIFLAHERYRQVKDLQTPVIP